MKSLVCVLSVLLLASCSNDWAAGLADRPATADRSSPASIGDAAASPIFGPAPHGGAPRAFASAPDRGSLVQYPQTPVVRRSGAYTFHAADLSEEHALRATVTGDLSFAAPDGTQIRLVYERHVEHPDGNWSWIGRAAENQGESTVITFGETAVFGTIPQGGDKPDLRLTVADGRTWVVTADPRLLREIRNEATHPTRPDFLIPGDLATAVGASAVEMDVASTSAESDTISAAATVDGNTIVDVLVGFTDGYASYRGGDSAAITRVHNLVEITNEAFSKSQVAVRARLVHSMKIAYPDATANKTALEEMTGFQAPSTRTTPAPAFSALRAARDQFGADLVVLLRRFQEPENGSCGVAWLIGGGLSGIVSSDQYFGYSVVSDGQDAGTDGKTYFCRDETFAHELGHNMGSQHDSENAKDDDGSVSYGAFEYSFGLKTSTGAGNFITVMASGDAGETRYRVFSNPNVSICGGFACGVAGQADNARSLRQTAPIVATFRASVVPSFAANDFSGDGMSDILWRNVRSGDNAIWHSADSTKQALSVVADLRWKVAGVGDFNGDGDSDILWRHAETGANSIWLSGGPINRQAVSTVADLEWSVVGVGDFNGDGRSDIVWRNVRTGAGTIWLSANSMNRQSLTQITDPGWKIVGVGDFNGDARSDLLWRHSGTGAGTIWFSGNPSDRQNITTITDLAWTVVGVGDFNGDGEADILWRHMKNGANTIWLSARHTTRQTMASVTDMKWKVVAVGDYNGDGMSDIFWRNAGNGANAIWLSAQLSTRQSVSTVADQDWRVVGQ